MQENERLKTNKTLKGLEQQTALHNRIFIDTETNMARTIAVNVLTKEGSTIDLNKYRSCGGLSEKDRKKIINYSKDSTKKPPEWLHATYLKTPGIIFNPDWFDLTLDYALPKDSEIQEIMELITKYLPGPKIWPKKEIKYLEEDFFGFPSSQDRLAWDSFHKCDSWDEKIQIKFKDQKSKRVAQRIIFDNAPETLDDQPYKVIIEFIKARWKNNDSKVPWVTISKAIEAINSLEKESNLDIFDGYKDYLLSVQSIKNPKKKYLFVHDEPSLNYKIDQSFFSKEYKVIKNDKNEILFNLGKGVFVNTKDSGNIDIETSFIKSQLLSTFEDWVNINGYDLSLVRIHTALIFINIAGLHDYPYSQFLFFLGQFLLQNELRRGTEYMHT